MPLPAALAHEQAMISLVLDSEDAHEGCRAFLEKRRGPPSRAPEIMQVQLTEEQALMLETARRVGADYGLDYWRDLDERGAYPSEMWQAICDAGFGGIALPEEHGGAGLGMLDQALVIEALCESGAGATLAQIFMVNPIFGGVAIARYGTEAMRRDAAAAAHRRRHRSAAWRSPSRTPARIASNSAPSPRPTATAGGSTGGRSGSRRCRRRTRCW